MREMGLPSTHPDLYSVWKGMRRRCRNPRAARYDRYGGRGISVSPEWDSFETFVRDMGPRPAGCTLDRIDPDGDYCRANCRWATRTLQARNYSRKTDGQNKHPGVFWDARKSTYRVHIYVADKQIYLASRKSFDEAVAIRKEAEKTYWENAK